MGAPSRSLRDGAEEGFRLMLRRLSHHRIGAADWLSLAAAPTFAAMALLTALGGDGPLEAFCAAASPIGGMVPMYLLMSAFHLVPWLKFFSSGWKPAVRQITTRS